MLSEVPCAEKGMRQKTICAKDEGGVRATFAVAFRQVEGAKL